MSYKHLSLEERYYFEISMKDELSSRKIAEKLNRSQSSISREITRNKGLRGYRHKQASSKAQERHKLKPKATKLTEEIKQLLKDN